MSLWDRYRQYLCVCDSIGLSLDVSRMKFPDGFLEKMEPAMQKAYAQMDALEKGAIANPDEKRMVGHYWLRDPERAPSAELRAEIEATVARVKKFANSLPSAKKAAQFVDVIFAEESFSKENGMLRPNLKIDRKAIGKRYL